MKRVIILIIASAMLTATVAVGADAQRSRRQPRGAQAAQVNAALTADMAGIEWGWSRRQLMDYFRAKIHERYRPRLAKAPGAIEEDALRSQMDRELQRIHESYFEFNGTHSGHDSSYLRHEFTHNNNEGMFRIRSESSDDYYFFINDRLWKWYRAFHASAYEGADFDGFSNALAGRYGRAEPGSGVLVEGGAETRWSQWQDGKTRVRAIDLQREYGFYSLVYEDKATIGRLDTLRANRAASNGPRRSLVDAVILDPDAEIQDPHADVLDRPRSTGASSRGSRAN